ncbi:hypothetical protein HMPREF9151_01517 [Hoylesella saccharolytica F0055]|uniref:Uncharacterized protein n=1 Tax=Hoylesella saccharolytica F0055 TaxID=1127699 RepID=L1N976_9BACT|nr:hypothetical protein HMPREF9151_01517 [Hoylesella saccharolytica F0055]
MVFKPYHLVFYFYFSPFLPNFHIVNILIENVLNCYFHDC